MSGAVYLYNTIGGIYMKIVYADMSIEQANFLLSTSGGNVIALSSSFGVSALRHVIELTTFADDGGKEKIFLVNCPLAVDMVANQMRSIYGNFEPFEQFLRVFRLLDICGNLLRPSIEAPTPLATNFCDLILSGNLCKNLN